MEPGCPSQTNTPEISNCSPRPFEKRRGENMSSEIAIDLSPAAIATQAIPESHSQKDDRAAIGRVAELLEQSGPPEALDWAFRSFGERVTIATGFGAEGITLIDMAVAVNPRVDVFFLDTGFLF